MKRRRSVSVFGLSFLDVMFCGFGSVILLVMIVNAETVERRETVQTDLRAEVQGLEREVLIERREVVAMRSELERVEEALARTRQRARDAESAIARSEDELEKLAADAASRTASVDSLKSELKQLDESARQLEQETKPASAPGTKVRAFKGDGDRQYLTGLKMGGKRILILVDTSASMLARTVVNVVRLRNMAPSAQRSARKWQRTLRTVDWLVSQLPRSARYQLYRFNTQASPALADTDGRWLSASDAATLNRAVAALREVVPADGTSMHRAFDAIGRLTPAPDNVILLTDGLPTQGRDKPRRSKVSSDERVRHFASAVSGLPRRLPVNVILFPMEGDPLAAAEFWKLAVRTRGAFLTPSRDWP